MRTEIWGRLRKEVIDLYHKLDTIDVHNNYKDLLKLKDEILTLHDRYSDIYQEINENFIDDPDKTEAYVKTITSIIEERTKPLITAWVKMGWEFYVGAEINKLVQDNIELFKFLIGIDKPYFHWKWIVPNFKFEEKYIELRKEQQEIYCKLNPTKTNNIVEWGKGCTLTDEEKKAHQNRLIEMKPSIDFLNSYGYLIGRQKDLSYFNLQFDYTKIKDINSPLKFEIGYLLFVNLHELQKSVNEEHEFLKDKTAPQIVQSIPVITYNSNNTITVQGKTIHFPFDCYNTCINLGLLKDELMKPTVSAITIQDFPGLIFDEKIFAGNFISAATVNNIIETIVEDAREGIHKGKKAKEKLLDWLISECETRALQFKELQEATDGKTLIEGEPSNFNPIAYTANKMKEKNAANEQRKKRREEQRGHSYNKLIDDKNYSPNIDDFKEKAKIESLDKSNPAQYLKFLRNEKERYANAIFYYNTYLKNEAENILRNVYYEIHGFIDSEIKVQLSTDIVPINSPEKEENDFGISTINDFLDPFKTKINDADYSKLINALKAYFDTGKFPEKNKSITVQRVNIKALGWALNNVYRAFKQGTLSIEYLQFAKDNISTFRNVDFDKADYKKSQLYKYFTTKTQ